jgi:hypothetical protein
LVLAFEGQGRSQRLLPVDIPQIEHLPGAYGSQGFAVRTEGEIMNLLGMPLERRAQILALSQIPEPDGPVCHFMGKDTSVRAEGEDLFAKDEFPGKFAQQPTAADIPAGPGAGLVAQYEDVPFLADEVFRL